MSRVSFTDLTADIAVTTRRRHVIEKLREAQEPMSVAELARAAGLHINTTRFHLDALVSEGLASRKVEEAGTRGRPRVLYTYQDAPGPRSFGLLASMLTAILAARADTHEATLKIGRSWGRDLIDKMAPAPGSNLKAQLVSFRALLDAIGFASEIAPVSDKDLLQLELHHCPFREVAEPHTEIICTLHLGLMQGALSQLGARAEALPLKPFVKPNLCTATLRLLPAIS